MGLLDQGFVIRIPGGLYIRGFERKPGKGNHVYMAANIEDAKLWYQPSVVRKARSRAALGGRILMVRRDEQGRRVIVGQLGKEEADGT